ncbi:hypothetical protein [Clostridium sp.]|uniref:hypothetical protein n=1 Tax=Clostridium sp. TaxID=1506 RepID=UPI003F35D192
MWIACCLKSKMSFEKLKCSFADSTVTYIESIDVLRDSILYNEYDLAIVDEKIDYKDEAIQLFKKKQIKGLIFRGDFKEIEEKVKPFLELQEGKKVDNQDKQEEGSVKVVNREVEVIKEVPVIQEIIKEKEVEVIKERYSSIASKSIGIINLNDCAGSTFIALNLAKMISEHEIITTLMQTHKGKLYESLELDKQIKDFYSFHHGIYEGKRVETNRSNTYKNISFIVPNNSYDIPEWHYNHMLKLLYSPVKNSLISIIDIGSEIENIYAREILNELDMIIGVVDPENLNVSIEVLRDLNKLGIPIWFVFNRCNPSCRIDKFIEQYKIQQDYIIKLQELEDEGEEFAYSITVNKEIFDTKFLKVVKEITPNNILNKQLDLEVATNRRENVKTQYITLSNAVIGVIGSESGVGVTHNALALANILVKEFKVAVLEVNSKSLRFIHQALDESKRNQFSYKGVDYYYNLDIADFLIQYKPQYEFLIIDFGAFDECIGFEEFIRCDRQYIVGHAIDWKVHKLLNFHSKNKEFDKKNNWMYIVPFLEKEMLSDLKNDIKNPILSIGTISNPFIIDNSIERLYKGTLGMKEERKKKFDVFKIFRKE